LNRAQPALVFAVILGTCIAAMLHVSPWAAVASASVLAIISLRNATRQSPATTSVAISVFLTSVTLNASAAACAAFILGRLIGWAWGL